MRAKFTVVLLLFVCLSVFGAQTTPVTVNQQESVSQLQAENEAMKKQLENLEKEVEWYRGEVLAKEALINDDLNHWLTIMGIMMAVIGIIIPLILNYRNEKSMEKMLEDVKKQAGSAESQAKEATTQAEQAKKSVVDIEEIKKHITTIEDKINKDTLAAENAAKEAKASQLFAAAVNEKNSLKAIDLYSKVLELCPDNVEAYINRGYEKDELNDTESALKDYNKAIELAPNDAAAYNNRGILKKKMNDTEGALADYNKAIELDPNFAEAYSNRGAIKSIKNDKEGALKDHNKTIELNPNLADAYNNRADLYLQIKDFDKALKDANKSIELGGEFVSFFTRGEIFMAMNNYIDAINDFTQAISYNPNSIETLEYRAKCYRKLAETEQDPAKKADLIAKAEADEKKAESLKKRIS